MNWTSYNLYIKIKWIINIKLFEEFTNEERQKLINTYKTYLKQNKIDIKNVLECDEILNKIKNYNFEKLNIKFDGFEIIITSDNEFKELLNNLNNLVKNKVDINFNFSLSIDKDRLNSINLDSFLPIILRGLNIGYKIYKLMIEFTSKICSGVIKKEIDNNKLVEILNQIKNNVFKIYQIKFEDIELDSELKEIMKNIWK